MDARAALALFGTARQQACSGLSWQQRRRAGAARQGKLVQHGGVQPRRRLANESKVQSRRRCAKHIQAALRRKLQQSSLAADTAKLDGAAAFGVVAGNRCVQQRARCEAAAYAIAAQQQQGQWLR